MANMPLNNAHPNLYLDYVQPTRRYSIERDPFMLLIEEVIDYSLRHHNIHYWNPPLNLDVARLMNEFTYFNETFAATVVNTEEQAMQSANRFGFNERKWLEFVDSGEARLYQRKYLLKIYDENKPFLHQMFSFACYASRIALQRNRHSLVNDVVWALLAALREILPPEEYYKEFCFVTNEYDNQAIDNRSLDVDEGIEDTSDEDSLMYTDPILLFVEELIDYSLRFNNLHGWIPPIDLEILRTIEISYFTENIRRSITHQCTQDYALSIALLRGFNEERWLELYSSSEAKNFQYYFLWQVLNHNNNDTLNNELFLFSFACYCSQIAMRGNRNSLVNEVVSALVLLLRQYYPHHQHYREFDEMASLYNRLHVDAHSFSDVGSIANEVIEVINEAGFSEEEAASHSDGEPNAAEERESLSSIEGNEATEESSSDDTEKNGGLHTLEEETEIPTFEEEGEIPTLEEEGEIPSLEEEGEIPTLEEEGEIHSLGEDS